MKTILMTVSLILVSGCSNPQNEVTVQAYTEQKSLTTEQSELRWYMKPEYRPAHRLTLNEHEKWVIKCLQDFEFIKPGVTRAEIMRKFPMDCGIQSVSPVRFLHPECVYFKIDVSFTFETDPNDQNRAVMGKEDKVTEVSKPYIENPYYD